MMATVTVSSKYQLMIPREAREALDIKPGQKMGVLVKGRTLHYVPIVGLDALQGAYPELNITGFREKEDRY